MGSRFQPDGKRVQLDRKQVLARWEAGFIRMGSRFQPYGSGFQPYGKRVPDGWEAGSRRVNGDGLGRQPLRGEPGPVSPASSSLTPPANNGSPRGVFSLQGVKRGCSGPVGEVSVALGALRRGVGGSA